MTRNSCSMPILGFIAVFHARHKLFTGWIVRAFLCVDQFLACHSEIVSWYGCITTLKLQSVNEHPLRPPTSAIHVARQYWKPEHPTSLNVDLRDRNRSRVSHRKVHDIGLQRP